MNLILHGRGIPSALASLALLAGLSGQSAAAWLSFRNDLGNTVVVQSLVKVKDRDYADKRRRLLYPGEVAQEGLVKPCVKVIKIFDGQTRKRLLHEETIPCAGDLFFSIRTDSMGHVILVPIKPPRRPPGRPAH